MFFNNVFGIFVWGYGLLGGPMFLNHVFGIFVRGQGFVGGPMFFRVQGFGVQGYKAMFWFRDLGGFGDWGFGVYSLWFIWGLVVQGSGFVLRAYILCDLLSPETYIENAMRQLVKLFVKEMSRHEKGCVARIAQICTLSQNGYGTGHNTQRCRYKA